MVDQLKKIHEIDPKVLNLDFASDETIDRDREWMIMGRLIDSLSDNELYDLANSLYYVEWSEHFGDDVLRVLRGDGGLENLLDTWISLRTPREPVDSGIRFLITPKDLMNRGKWSEYCDIVGWDEYIVNEGKLDPNSSIEITLSVAKQLDLGVNS